MRRFGVIVALGALLGMIGGVTTAAPALARGPKWQFMQEPPTFTVPADFCGFEIQGTQLVHKVFEKDTNNADGSVTRLFTGVSKISLTNPANGKSVSVNTSGPAKTTVNADGSLTARATGREPGDLSPAEQQLTGLPGMFASAGPVTGAVDAHGNLTSLNVGHILVNICAALS